MKILTYKRYRWKARGIHLLVVDMDQLNFKNQTRNHQVFWLLSHSLLFFDLSLVTVQVFKFYNVSFRRRKSRLSALPIRTALRQTVSWGILLKETQRYRSVHGFMCSSWHSAVFHHMWKMFFFLKIRLHFTSSWALGPWLSTPLRLTLTCSSIRECDCCSSLSWLMFCRCKGICK